MLCLLGFILKFIHKCLFFIFLFILTPSVFGNIFIESVEQEKNLVESKFLQNLSAAQNLKELYQICKDFNISLVAENHNRQLTKVKQGDHILLLCQDCGYRMDQLHLFEYVEKLEDDTPLPLGLIVEHSQFIKLTTIGNIYVSAIGYVVIFCKFPFDLWTTYHLRYQTTDFREAFALKRISESAMLATGFMSLAFFARELGFFIFGTNFKEIFFKRNFNFEDQVKYKIKYKGYFPEEKFE